MKRLILFIVFVSGAFFVKGQIPITVTAPSLEIQEAANHVEQMQQAVQTYETMVNVREGIDKGIDAVEKVNSKLATIREVQEIATRSAACINRIRKVYDMISKMDLGVRQTTDLLQMCNRATRDCIDVTAYGAKIFSNNFLKMNDAERLTETRKVLDDIDKLLMRTGYISTQARAIRFNNQLIDAYIH